MDEKIGVTARFFCVPGSLGVLGGCQSVHNLPRRGATSYQVYPDVCVED